MKKFKTLEEYSEQPLNEAKQRIKLPSITLNYGEVNNFKNYIVFLSASGMNIWNLAENKWYEFSTLSKLIKNTNEDPQEYLVDLFCWDAGDAKDSDVKTVGDFVEKMLSHKYEKVFLEKNPWAANIDMVFNRVDTMSILINRTWPRVL